MVTSFMNLTLPTPSVTLGPQWDNELNTALQAIDSHDHSNGKGTTVKTAGIEINADLNFNSFRAFGLKSLKLATQDVQLSGGTHAQSLFSFNGDLYYTNSAGTAVPITAGAGLVPSAGAVQQIEYTVVASSPYTPSSADVMLAVDTTSARTIQLPAAASLASGRIYVVKDLTGASESNPITILPGVGDNIDGEGSSTGITLNSNFGTVFLVCDAANRWSVI
jgi:hypothetical protein